MHPNVLESTYIDDSQTNKLPFKKKQKTNHDWSETNISFDLLGIKIQGNIRSKQPSRLGSIENPRLRKNRLKSKVKGDYYYQMRKGQREISFWNGKCWHCEHGRRRSQCKECGGSEICEHDRIRSKCKECGGASICEHDRIRSQCKECDPHNYIAHILRNRLKSGLKSQMIVKSKRTVEYIGCSHQQLREHLESQFEDGMTWENMGTRPDGTPGWDVDHRRPCKSFDLQNEEARYMCFHWTNLQPMWHEENIRKNAYYDEANFPYKWMGREIGWVGRRIKTKQSDLRKKYKCIP